MFKDEMKLNEELFLHDWSCFFLVLFLCKSPHLLTSPLSVPLSSTSVIP